MDSPFAGIDAAGRRATCAGKCWPSRRRSQEARVWATLTDNSPLVTAQARGRGLIVLFHVSAGPDWSDVPLSGLFVEMLRRTLAFAARADGAGEREITGGPFVAQRLLDGYGALAPAPPDAAADRAGSVRDWRSPRRRRRPGFTNAPASPPRSMRRARMNRWRRCAAERHRARGLGRDDRAAAGGLVVRRRRR